MMISDLHISDAMLDTFFVLSNNDSTNYLLNSLLKIQKNSPHLAWEGWGKDGLQYAIFFCSG